MSGTGTTNRSKIDYSLAMTRKTFDAMKEKVRELQSKISAKNKEELFLDKASDENGGFYFEACEDPSHGFLNNRLAEMEYVLQEEGLGRVLIIDDMLVNTARVSLGTLVKVRMNNQQEEYAVLGPWDSCMRDLFTEDIVAPCCSLGKAIFGKKVKDVVTIETPDGPVEMEILSISKYFK